MTGHHLIGRSQTINEDAIATVPLINLFNKPWRTPALLSLITVTALLLVLADFHSPIRAVIVAPFIFAVPGYALLDIWDLTGGWIGAALVVALSTSLATLLSLVLFYAGAWSSHTALTVLVLITLTSNVANIMRHGYRYHTTGT